MAAFIVEIAERVKDTLNGATLSFSFTATRAYVPVHEQEALTDLTVTVVPRELLAEALSRNADNFAYIVEIGVQQRFDSPSDPTATLPMTTEAIDDRMQLVEEIVDLFRGKRLDMGAYSISENVNCVTVENPPIYSPEHLDQHRTFTSIVRLTFRVVRAQTS